MLSAGGVFIKAMVPGSACFSKGFYIRCVMFIHRCRVTTHGVPLAYTNGCVCVCRKAVLPPAGHHKCKSQIESETLHPALALQHVLKLFRKGGVSLVSHPRPLLLPWARP